MAQRRVLLASNYNAWPEAFNGQAYAFLNVIRQLEDADLLAPPAGGFASGRGVRPSFSYLLGELYHRSKTSLGRLAGVAAGSPMAPVRVEHDYDLFAYVCQFPLELSALNRMRGWRKRSKVAVAYILETWSHLLPQARSELNILDQFDIVYVLNKASIPALRRYTSTRCRPLPSASDCLLSTPLPLAGPRPIDVYSMGRRSPAIHTKMMELAQESADFTYVYDTMRHGMIPSWPDHRFLTAQMIKRSQYFVAYDHNVEDAGPSKNFTEPSLSTRYFEGAAGGAVLIGSRPQAPEFSEHFDWDDAVIELPTDTQDLARYFRELAAQGERLQIARMTAAVESLRRHDWAHRWSAILRDLGLEETEAHRHRKRRMDEIAAIAQSPRVISLNHLA